jgi:hypothetical protein
MPIRPIDLQTLLMQMSQVGRDQAIEKDGPALQNAMQAAAAQKREIESKESVRKAEDSKEGPAPVKDGRGRSKGREAKAGAEGEGDEADAEASDKPDEEVVRDPSLGNRVDLSG